MQTVSEAIIDREAERVAAEEDAHLGFVEQLEEAQPDLLAYLFSDSFEAFTEAEQQYFLYLAQVIWEAVMAVREDSAPVIEADQIGKLEEANWAVIGEVKSKKFQERIDPFFEKTEQEDLLAFIEDALAPDEEAELVTPEGREAMFVSLKTVLDCLT